MVAVVVGVVHLVGGVVLARLRVLEVLHVDVGGY